MAVVRTHPEPESPHQVHNGNLGHHDDRTAGEVCQLKQEQKVLENGVFGSAASPSLSLSQENGTAPSRDEQENPEKDKEEGLGLGPLLGPGPPRRKRGRRKLERPTKCKPW